MRLSTEVLAVSGDAREEVGLGRRQLWFAIEPDAPAYADVRADAYAYIARAGVHAAYADVYAYAAPNVDAYADVYADIAEFDDITGEDAATDVEVHGDVDSDPADTGTYVFANADADTETAASDTDATLDYPGDPQFEFFP